MKVWLNGSRALTGCRRRSRLRRWFPRFDVQLRFWTATTSNQGRQAQLATVKGALILHAALAVGRPNSRLPNNGIASCLLPGEPAVQRRSCASLALGLRRDDWNCQSATREFVAPLHLRQTSCRWSLLDPRALALKEKRAPACWQLE